MDLNDLKNVEECFKCGCLYIEHDRDNKCVISQFLCNGCSQSLNSTKVI